MILGVSVSSRVIGMAAIDCQTLVEHKVRLFKERWSLAKAQKIINCIAAFANDYSVASVALMLPPVHHRTPETKHLLTKIKSYCRKRKLPLYCCRHHELQAFSGTERAKKRALMRELCSRYPDLVLEHQKELRNKKKYYHKLFEAVGAATLALTATGIGSN